MLFRRSIKGPKDFTIEGFLAFIKAQPVLRGYDVMDVNNCPLAEYGKSLGFPKARGGIDYIRLSPDSKVVKEIVGLNLKMQIALFTCPCYGDLAEEIERLLVKA